MHRSGDHLQRGEEHFGSGCTFQTGGKCLISSVISFTSDPLSVILTSFVFHLTPHLEALWIRYWIGCSVFIWHSRRSQTVINKQISVSVGLGHQRMLGERQHSQHPAALPKPRRFWGEMRHRLCFKGLCSL